MRLKDKVVVVTGSTRGIGRAIAYACAKEGAQVVISSRTAPAVDKVVSEFKDEGFAVSGMVCDTSKASDLEKLFQHSKDNYKRVDAWINNAGVSGGYQPLDEFEENELQTVIDINVSGVLQACRIVIPYFRERSGVIINMVGMGWKGNPAAYSTPYAASKAAVASLTKSLAKENKDAPISIHAVAPGMVRTSLFKNLKVSPKVEENMKIMPYLLNALGADPESVGEAFVPIVAQEPGKTSGKIYSFLKGWRRVRGISLLAWYGVTGKMKTSK